MSREREWGSKDLEAGHPGQCGPRHWLLRFLDAVLTLGATGLAIMTVLPFLHPLWPQASLAEHFALQILVGSALLIAPALVRWRWLVPLLSIALVQTSLIHPYWPRLTQAAPAASEKTLKLVSFNVRARSVNHDQVRQYLLESDADIIGLLEMSPKWQAEIVALQGLYPYQAGCLDEARHCRQMLLSRIPLVQTGETSIEDSLAVVTWAEISVPGQSPAGTATIAIAHLTRPFAEATHDSVTLPPSLPDLAQAMEAQRVADRLRGFGRNLIVMGDFNAAPWSRIQQRLRQTTGLDNQGFLAPSWPAWAPVFLRLPIDHIMTRGDLRILSFVPGSEVGSDHLPVEATIALMTQMSGEAHAAQ